MTKDSGPPALLPPRTLRALILEDTPLDAELTVAAFKNSGYTLHYNVLSSRDQFEQEIARGEYDIILADYDLGSWTAKDALESQSKSGKVIPVVIVTGALGDEAAVKCIKLGAADYVLKQQLEHLPLVVEQVLHDKVRRDEAASLQGVIRRGKKVWELTFDTVPDAIFVVDSKYRIERANRAAADLLGVDFPKLIGRPFYSAIFGDDRPPRNSPFQQLLLAEQEEPADFEAILFGKVFHTTANPLRDPAEFLLGSVIVLRDITDRKQAEAALAESENRFRSLVENATVGIYRTTPDGKILMANPPLVKMLGFDSFQELASRNLETEGLGANFPRSAFREQVERKGKIQGLESAWIRRDGSVIFVRESASVFRDSDGKVLYYDGICEDITERKNLEDQLRQAQKMEAIGRLAGGVAHDFNNLLTIITGYSQLAIERLSGNKRVSEFVEEVKDAGERAATLTRQLLAFSRRQILQPCLLDMNSVVSNVEKMLRRLIGEDVDLIASLAPDLGTVRADPGQIEQVIMNLAVNARDAMPKGGKLTIATANANLDESQCRAGSGVKPGPYVMLSLTDTGTGMDEATRARIFEPFFTTKEQGKGTGLGLATVYGIVKQSGGDIQVFSEPGQGTTMRIYLPRVEGIVAGKQPDPPVAETRGNETILLVEDEQSLRSLLRGVLESAGYKVIEARKSSEALEISRTYSGPVHLLLTDIVMPELRGTEIAERILAKRAGIKVLFISGYSDGEVAPERQLDPGIPILQKPFTPEALALKVREVLGPKSRD